MAQKGRKVAGFALIKSVAYNDFLDEALETGRKSATVGRLKKIGIDLRKRRRSLPASTKDHYNLLF